MRLMAAIATLLAAAAWSAAAHAATPFVLDQTEGARDAAVAIDAEGTAHVVWNLNRTTAQGGDVLVYCQVPRNKRACATKKTFALKDGDTAGPRVFLRGDRVVLVSHRCCSQPLPGSKNWILISDDGGSTFSQEWTGTNGMGGDAELGPGPFSLSTVNVQSFGARFQVVPLRLPTGQKPVEQIANLGANAPIAHAWFDGTVAFVDPLTPLVGMAGGGQVLVRRFGGGTAYNDVGSWGPFLEVADGDDPSLVGLQDGRKGVFAFVRAGQPGRQQYVVRRWHDAARTFGAPTGVSEVGSPLFGEFTQDATGRLHAAWHNNLDDSLRYRSSKAGGAWKPSERLATKEQTDDEAFFDLEIGSARDGGGLIVWGRGPVRAVQFGPTGPIGGGDEEGNDCVEQLTVGVATILAREGCLTKTGDRYTTTKDLRVNGVDLEPNGVTVTIDKGDRTLSSVAAVRAKVGNVVLGSKKLAWRFPTASGSKIADLAGNPATFDTGAAGTSLLGLDVSGYTTITLLSGGRAQIPDVNLTLPQPFGSLVGSDVTGAVLLRTSNDGGLELNGLSIHIQDVWLGIAEIESFDIKFVGDPFLLYGKTSLLLPVVQSRLGIEFQLREGDFDYGKATLEFTNPAQLPVATDVLLKKIGFEVQKGHECGHPTKIGGSVSLAVGPTVGSFALIRVDGSVSYSFPQSTCNLPGVLDVKGEGYLVGIKVATLQSRFTTDLQLTFSTRVELGGDSAGVSVALEGGVDIPQGTFYAAGEANIRLAGVDVFTAKSIVSSVGMAACGQVGPVAAGFEYRWGGSFEPDWPPVCDVDLDDFKPAGFLALHAYTSPVGLSVPAVARATRATFTLPAGLPVAEVRLDGAGAAPGFVLTGPNGLHVEHAGEGAPLGRGAGFAVFAAGAADRTFVSITAPAAGVYTVADGAGPAIANVSIANGLPEPSVRGNLRRAASGAFVLSFSARAVKDQVLRIVEDGPGVHNVLLVTPRAEGSIRFVPSAGPAGRRTIEALVESDGMPRARIRLAEFTYRRPVLGRPRGVRIARRGTTLVVTWRAAAGASRYAVRYALRDGRRGTDLVRARRYVLRNVPGIDSGTIWVSAVARDNRAGTAVVAKLKAKPLKPRVRRTR